MKGLFVIAILLLPCLTNACLCNGKTEAECTDPCYKCGLCNKKCCQNLFERKEVEIDEKDRFIFLCGRNLVESRDSTDLDPGKYRFSQSPGNQIFYVFVLINSTFFYLSGMQMKRNKFSFSL